MVPGHTSRQEQTRGLGNMAEIPAEQKIRPKLTLTQPPGRLSSSPCLFMAKLTIKHLNVHGKRVLVRVDFNVPMEEKAGQMVINDATRIKETLPTLEFLIKNAAKTILTAHLGRPKGQRDASLSLRPVAAKLAEMLHCNVAFVDD